uniref:Atos-like conserved domain-containing protein n=1 Tax=Magallana gigas TaxID=29159 RepID=K1PH18_MAGGI
MKPGTESSEMEDYVWDPVAMFVDVGILIVEARTPDLSLKGRIEGPHCPHPHGGQGVKVKDLHRCDLHREQCRRADQIRTLITGLSRNHIPLNLDVLLLPGCDHGQREACTVEGSSVGSNDDLILLERWEVSLQQKRLITGLVVLYYSVHSKKLRIHYLRVHGAELLRVSVASLPRLTQIPTLLCQDKKNGGRRKKHSSDLLDRSKVKQSPDLCDRSEVKDEAPIYKSGAEAFVPEGMWSKKTEELRRTSPELFQDQRTSSTEDHQRTSLKRQDQELGAIPKKKNLAYKTQEAHAAAKPPIVKRLEGSEPVERLAGSPASELKKSFKARPLPLASDKGDNEMDSDFLVRRLPSPKVLFTTAGKSTQKIYKKRHLDLSSPECADEQVLASKISGLVRPLKAEDLESYLTSISSHQSGKPIGTSLSNIPTMHCDFYFGDKMFPSHNEHALKTLLQESSVSPWLKQSEKDGESDTPTTKQSRSQRSVVCNLQEKLAQESQHSSSEKAQTCITYQHSPEFPESGEEWGFMKEWKTEVYPANKKKNRGESSSKTQKPSKKVETHDNHRNGDNTATFIPTDCVVTCDKDDRNRDKRIPDKITEVSCHSLSLFDDFVDEINDIQSGSSASLTNIPCVNSRLYSPQNGRPVDSLSSQPSPVYSTDKSKQEHCPNQNKTHEFQNEAHQVQYEANLGHKYSDFRPSFKKSFSEPEMLGNQLSLSQLNDLKLSPDENLADLDSVLSRSFHDILCLDKSSSDSTPTNSLLNSNGFQQYGEQDDASVDEVKTLRNKHLMNQDLLVSDSYVNSKSGMVMESTQNCVQNNGVTTVSSTPAKSEETRESEETVVLNNGNLDDTSNSCYKERNGVISDSIKNGFLMGASEKPIKNGVMGCELRTGKENGSCKDEKRCNKNTVEEESLQVKKSLCTQLLKKELHRTNKGAPLKRRAVGRFDYDNTLVNSTAIKNALSCSKLTFESESSRSVVVTPDRTLSTSAPASTNCLLGNFEESVLNGRIEPIGVVDGFTCDIGAGGSFCPKHVSLPVTAYFFQLSDDNAPSPYLGHINLESIGKKGYHIPKCGTVQVTLFNPNKTVIKMFVVMYDLSDMPPHCQTFLRQRTVYMPVEENSSQPSYLRYLIHLRFASSKSGKIFLHTDIRVLFARDKFEFDPSVAKYELRSFTEVPSNPKFSPRR